jgi:hypothetical protein
MGGEVYTHQIILDDTYDAYPRAKPVSLYRLQPYAAHCACIGLVPDAATFIHVRFLLATGSIGIHSIDDADGKAVGREKIVFLNLVGKGGILTDVGVFALYGAKLFAI